MANSCAGLDPSWAHLPAPAATHTPHAAAAAGHCHSTTSSSSWLFPAAAAFENEALTSALRASMAPAASSYPATPSSSSTSSASELLSGGSGHDASALAVSSRPAPPARAGPNKAGGRVAKRKPRPSRRPPPTYITADPANFRRLVQEVTGFPGLGPYSDVPQAASVAAAEGASTAPSYAYTAAPASVLPTLDTSAFLLDHAAPAAAAMVREEKISSGGASSVTAITAAAATLGRKEKISSGGASSAMAVTAAAAVDVEDSSVLQELEAMACAQELLCDDFPTLESWGIII